MNSANYVSVSKGRARQQKLGDTSSNELASSQIYFGQPCTGCSIPKSEWRDAIHKLTFSGPRP